MGNGRAASYRVTIYQAPVFNATGSTAAAYEMDKILPDDIYSSDAIQFYGAGHPSVEREGLSILQRIRGQPDARVMIYRAVPASLPNPTIIKGDWVTTVKGYAAIHGKSKLGDFKIISKTVRANQIFSNGNYPLVEFGYDPRRRKR